MNDSPVFVAPAPPKRNTWLLPALKYGVAVALLVFIIAMNWTALKDLFSREPHAGPFAVAASVYLVILAMQYVRWWVLVRALGLPFRFATALRLGMVGTFYNTFLPGAIGGDAVKIYFIVKGHPERKAAAAATVVADRLLGLFGLLLFAAGVGGGCWAAGNERIAGNPILQWMIGICGALVVAGSSAFIGMGFLPARRQERFAERLRKVRKAGPLLAEFWFTAVEYRRRPGVILIGVLLSAIAHTAMIVSFHYAVRVFPPADLNLLGTLAEHFVIAPIGFIFQALVPVPGGLGFSELGFGGLYQAIRGKEADAVGLAGRLSLRVVEWFLGLVGYIAYLTMKAELPKGAEPAAVPGTPADVGTI